MRGGGRPAAIAVVDWRSDLSFGEMFRQQVIRDANNHREQRQKVNCLRSVKDKEPEAIKDQ